MAGTGMPAASRRRRVGGGLVLSLLVSLAPATAVVVLSASPVVAQTASDTPRCVNAINKGMRKVTLAATKQVRSCIGAHASGALGSQTVAQCCNV